MEAIPTVHRIRDQDGPTKVSLSARATPHHPMAGKAFTKLLGLQYKICYKKGTENCAADALSCLPHTENIMAVSSCQLAWLEDIEASYHTNPQAQCLLEQLAIRPDPKGRFSLSQGILCFRNRIWLGGSIALQQQTISAFHDSPVGEGALRLVCV